MSVDPWLVFWATCKQNSQRNFRSNFGPAPDLSQIKEWQYFQSNVDPSTTLIFRFHTGPPGGPKRKSVRFCDHGEMIGPVLGTARRTYMKGAGFFPRLKPLTDARIKLSWRPQREDTCSRASAD
eukprot:616893-Pyramimonas_sp.AAC.1